MFGKLKFKIAICIFSNICILNIVGDENLSPYLEKTMSTLYPDFDKSKYDDTQLYKANQFHCVNGLVSSVPRDLIIKNYTVDWHLLGWGTYWDVKYIKWENSQISWNDEVVDYIRLMPASFYTATIKPFQRKGQFKFGSLDDEGDGMLMKYSVSL